MSENRLNLDFELLAKSFPKYIREKARKAGSTIVYKEGDQLIEEDPHTRQKRVLKTYS